MHVPIVSLRFISCKYNLSYTTFFCFFEHAVMIRFCIHARFTEEYFANPQRGYGGSVSNVFTALKNSQYVDVYGPAAKQFNGMLQFAAFYCGKMTILLLASEFPIEFMFHDVVEELIWYISIRK